MFTAINEFGCRGWPVIETAAVESRPVVDCHRDDLKYLRSLFLTS